MINLGAGGLSRYASQGNDAEGPTREPFPAVSPEALRNMSALVDPAAAAKAFDGDAAPIEAVVSPAAANTPRQPVEFRRFVNAVLERAGMEGGVFEWRGPRGAYFREAFLQRATENGLVRRIRVLDEEYQGNIKRTVRFTEPSHGGSERRAVTYETDGDGNGVLDNPRFVAEVAWWRAQIES